MVGEGPYRALLVLSLDEEEVLWQTLDEALGHSLRRPDRAYELALFVYEESRNRSRELWRASAELLAALWGVGVELIVRD
jgi:hypothetical protein